MTHPDYWKNTTLKRLKSFFFELVPFKMWKEEEAEYPLGFAH